MRSIGIKTKLILVVSALTAALLVATAAAFFGYYRRTLERQIAEAQFALAEVVAHDIDDKLRGAHAELIELAHVVGPDLLQDAPRAQGFLDEHSRIHAFFSNGLFLFDARGTIIAESPQYNRRGQNFGFREYLLTTFRTRRPYIGAPYRSSRPGSPPAIMMTAPVVDARGELVGVLGGAVDLLADGVLGRTVRLHSGTSGYFYLFDRNRTMILHPDPARVLKQDVPPGANKLLDRALEGFEGSAETVNSRGLRAITSFKHLTSTDWIVGVNRPTAEAHAPIESARRTLVVVVAVVILGVTLVIWRVMNRLTRPLLAFTAHVEAMPRMQGAARTVAVASRDEIGQLAAAFNRMVEALDVKQEEVETERRRSAQVQKMEAVGQLAGGVAHDFNNLLSVILAFASSLREELPEGDLRSCAVEIERAGRRAATLTRQLLAFSRRQVVVPEVLAVREVVGNLGYMIGRLIGERIELTLELTQGSGHVRMDPTQLEQVLVNLVVNARDAMPEGGKLTIEARDLERSAADDGGTREAAPCVEIRVSDTGTGMDPATRARIFEPFFTTKPKGKGTGLGLAMVYAAIEQSGGTIDVVSSPGAGTTFTIRLPRVPAPVEHDALHVAGAAPRGQGECVLLVEDESQLRATLRRFLSLGGYAVLEAECGEAALEVFHAQRDRIDLVLTDVVMPGMGGIALGRAVRELRSVPVLYMSGYSEDVALGKERLAPDMLLQKPFERDVLLRRVRAALGGVAADRAEPPPGGGRLAT